MDHLEARLRALGGVVLAGAEDVSGITRSARRHAVERGRLVRVWPGTYVDARLMHDPSVLRRAALEAAGPTAVLSHRTSAEMRDWNTRWWPRVVPATDVSIIRPAHLRSHPGLRVHQLTRLADVDRSWVDGLPCTAAARTVVDLARELRRDALIGLIAWLLQHSQTGVDELRDAADRAKGLGALRVLNALGEWEPGVESLAEFRFARAVRRSTLPLPQWNRIVLVDGVARRVDALWDEAGLGVEIKGRTYHGDDAWEADLLRNADVIAEGVTILELPARAVLADLDRVMAIVGKAVLVRWPAGLPFARLTPA